MHYHNLLISSALLLLACSSPVEASDSSGSAWTGNPVDGVGRLMVTVPAKTAAATLLAQRADGGADPITLTTDTLLDVSAGKYCLFTKVGGFETARDCSVSIAPGATVLYNFGAVTFTRTSAAFVWGIDFDADPTRPSVAFLRRKDAAPHAVGDFSYPYMGDDEGARIADAIDVHVAAGVVNEIDLTSVAGRASAIFEPARWVSLEDATVGVDLALVFPDYQTAPHQPFSAFGASFLVRGYEPATLRMFNPSSAWRNDIALSPAGEPTKHIQLGRLEIDKVTVDMPDGSRRVVDGTFDVRSGRDVVVSGVPLGKGIDMMPGHYTATLHYTHPFDGAAVETTMDADVTP